jgi:hypothetical protein
MGLHPPGNPLQRIAFHVLRQNKALSSTSPLASPLQVPENGLKGYPALTPIH